MTLNSPPPPPSQSSKSRLQTILKPNPHKPHTGHPSHFTTRIQASRMHHLFLLVATLLTMGTVYIESANASGECSADSDCVASSCCHASGCVSKNDGAAMQAKGDCSSQICTSNCEGFTLDCGGSCFCTELKTCGAMLNINGHAPPALGSTHPLDFGEPPKKRKKYTYGYTKVRR